MAHEYSVAVVTGAGSGIGRATAVLLGQAGWTVVIAGRDGRKLAETAAAMKAGRTLVHAGDLTQDGAAEKLVLAARHAFGRIDALANVAGYAAVASITQTTDELWQQTLEVNLSVPFRLIRAVWPLMSQQQRGVIVNVSSMASLDPFPGFAAYAPSKAGLNMVTTIAAREGKALGIRAVTIAPGAVETPMLRSAFGEDVISKEQTLRPEEVGRLIVACITGERRFEGGEVIPIVPGGCRL